MSYDAWKTAAPDYDGNEAARCPHNEDSPDNCPVCCPDETGRNVDKLVALLDASEPLQTEVTIWEEDVPGADYTARLWASTKPGYTVLDVLHEQIQMRVTRICKEGRTRVIVCRNVGPV